MLLFSQDYVLLLFRVTAAKLMKRHSRVWSADREFLAYLVPQPNNETVRISMLTQTLTHGSEIIQMLSKQIKRALAEHMTKCERNM